MQQSDELSGSELRTSSDVEVKLPSRAVVFECLRQSIIDRRSDIGLMIENLDEERERPRVVHLNMSSSNIVFDSLNVVNFGLAFESRLRSSGFSMSEQVSDELTKFFYTRFDGLASTSVSLRVLAQETREELSRLAEETGASLVTVAE